MQSSALQVDKEFGSLKVNSVEATSGMSLRHGATSALIVSQPAPTDLGAMTGPVTLTIAQLLTKIVHGDPDGASRNLTLPTAALAVAGVSGARVGDSIDVHVINQATAGADEPMELVMGAGGTLVGEATVEAAAVATEESSGSAHLRVRFTNVTVGSEAYTVYRLA